MKLTIVLVLASVACGNRAPVLAEADDPFDFEKDKQNAIRELEDIVKHPMDLLKGERLGRMLQW